MAAVSSKRTVPVFLLITFCIHIVVTEPLRFKPHYVDPEQDWSYVDVRDSAHMFYWLYYTTNTKGYQNTPLVMWLQGGPGGSGTGFGNFEEIGPLDVSLNPRNTTWLQTASLLFVDNPVGTGFSYVDTKAAYTHNVQEIAADMLVLLKTFFMEKSKQFQEVPFYIFSESYGGKMTAEISLQLYKAIQNKEINCNFKGLAMGDSWISPVDSTLSWGPYAYTNSLLDETGLAAVNKSAQRVKSLIQQGQWSEATNAWGATQTTVSFQTSGVNFYNILKWGAEESSLFKDNKDGKVKLMLSKLHQDSLAELMNGKVREKLGIIPDSVKWGAQSEDVFATQAGDFMKPVVDTVNELIKSTDLQVVVYSGQLDLIVDTVGTEEWVYTLDIANQYRNATKKPIINPVTKRYPSGYVKSVNNFSFYWILDAGHMVPSDNGETALKMLQMIINKQ